MGVFIRIVEAIFFIVVVFGVIAFVGICLTIVRDLSQQIEEDEEDTSAEDDFDATNK